MSVGESIFLNNRHAYLGSREQFDINRHALARSLRSFISGMHAPITGLVQFDWRLGNDW